MLQYLSGISILYVLYKYKCYKHIRYFRFSFPKRGIPVITRQHIFYLRTMPRLTCNFIVQRYESHVRCNRKTLLQYFTTSFLHPRINYNKMSHFFLFDIIPQAPI